MGVDSRAVSLGRAVGSAQRPLRLLFLAVALLGPCARLVLRRIDRQLQVVGADALTLRVRIRQRASLQHLVLGKIDAVDQHAGAERRLLGLGKHILRWRDATGDSSRRVE